MRLTLGSYTIDGTPASSTTNVAALRLEFEGPLNPKKVGNQISVRFRVYLEAANEAALKTACEELISAVDQADGKTVIFYNTTGTALFTLDTALWPQIAVDWDEDRGDVNSRFVIDVTGTRPEPVSGGAADEPGQRGAIEWELEIGPNGLQGATATAEFGPGGGNSPIKNASVWVAKMWNREPDDIPAHFSTRLRACSVSPIRAIQKPNQATITEDSYDPVAVSILYREVYAGLATIPDFITDVNVNVSLAEEEEQDVRAGENEGPAIITLAGWFTVITESPTSFMNGATKVARDAIYAKAIEAYNAIELDFLTIYRRFSLLPLNEAKPEISPDSGRVLFSRSFSTTRVRKWRERMVVKNVDPVAINRVYNGPDVVHHGRGGPVAVLVHSMYVESLQGAVPYTPPSLDENWVRNEAEGDAEIITRRFGNVLIHITVGSSTWRYAQPTPRGPSDQNSRTQRQITHDNVGNGTL